MYGQNDEINAYLNVCFVLGSKYLPPPTSACSVIKVCKIMIKKNCKFKKMLFFLLLFTTLNLQNSNRMVQEEKQLPPKLRTEQNVSSHPVQNTKSNFSFSATSNITTILCTPHRRNYFKKQCIQNNHRIIVTLCNLSMYSHISIFS